MSVLIIIVFSLLLSAFFSGSEMAFVAANRLRVEMRAREHGRIGALTSDFIGKPSQVLTTTLVGNNLALVAYSTATALLLEPALTRTFVDGLGLDRTIAHGFVLVAQTTIASVIVLVFGEILPKSIMREAANRAVFALAIPLRIANYVLLPLIWLAAGASTLLIKLLGTSNTDFPRLLRRDFELLIEESVDRGSLDIDEEEQTLISNVFALDSMKVKESMIPRTEVEAVEDDTTLEELRQKFIETGFSKLPVFHDNIENIVGIAYAHDLFQEPQDLKSMLRPVEFVPDSRGSKALLRDFLNRNLSIALVLDEYGGIAGIVTLEDLLEELFGDIQDEFDTEDDVMRRLSQDTFLLSGRAELDALEEKFSLKFPEGDYETVAGFILENLGTIPTPQEEFQIAGYQFNILRSTANRIDLIRLTSIEPARTPDSSGEDSDLG